MGSKHNVRTRRLCQVIKLTRDISVVKVQCKYWLVIVSKQRYVRLGRHWFGNGSLQANICNDGVYERLLDELNASSLQPFDVDSHIVGWVTLVLNLNPRALKLSYYC